MAWFDNCFGIHFKQWIFCIADCCPGYRVSKTMLVLFVAGFCRGAPFSFLSPSSYLALRKTHTSRCIALLVVTYILLSLGYSFGACLRPSKNLISVLMLI
jgi:hypothetical protein